MTLRSRSSSASDLSTAAWQRRLDVLEAFEQAFQRGERPIIDDFLGGTQDETERHKLLVDLVHADLELRLKAGQPIGAEMYLDRYRTMREPAAAVELIAAEFAWRSKQSAVSFPQFAARFPEYSEQLQDRLELPKLRVNVEQSSFVPAVAALSNEDAALSPTTVPAEVPAVIAGPPMAGYEIESELGRGGMGVIYRARQEKLKRVVALKMILSGEHAGPAEIVRFKTEAEAIARLRHPNIVQIYEVGEHEGKPYLSLEFCEGGSLDKRLAGTPLPPNDAASLVRTLAEAMEVAHQARVIHRDLKPANVLLAQDGTPKITDFGLARKLDEAGQTVTGAVMGTPSYMAPEQAQGKKTIGPGTDIYALGAILYQCLTGRPPFKAATTFETLQQVIADEPVPPAQLNAKVPRDLETICLKCLHKEPARRYVNAADLADDLLAFLEGRPIQARPVGTLERAWKWAARRPAVASLIGLIFLGPTMLATVIGAYSVHVTSLNVQLEQSNTAVAKANKELQTTNTQLEQSERSLKSAYTKLDEENKNTQRAMEQANRAEQDAQQNYLLAQRATNELLRTAREGLRNKPGTEDVRRQLLAAGKKLAIPFTAAPARSPAARLRAAIAHSQLGELEEAFGDNNSAVSDYEASLKLYRELMSESARQSWLEDYEREELGVAMKLFSALEVLDPARAEAELNKLLIRFEKLLAAGANADRFRRYHAALLANRALHAQRRGSYTAADADYRTAARLLESEQQRSGAQMELAQLQINQAALWLVMGTTQPGGGKELLQQAGDACRKALRTLDVLHQAQPNNVAIAEESGRAYTNLGLVLLNQGEVRAAAKVQDEAIAFFTDLSQKAPRIVGYRHLLANSLGNRGNSLLRAGKPEAAVPQLAQARKLLEDLVAGFDDVADYRHDLARICDSLGVVLLLGPQPAQAREPLERAYALCRNSLAREPGQRGLVDRMAAVRWNLVACLDKVARDAGDRRDWKVAETYITRLVELRREQERDLPAPGSNDALVARLRRAAERIGARIELIGTLQALAKVQEQCRDHAAATRSVRDLEALLPPSWPGYVDVAALLARCVRLAQSDSGLVSSERARLAAEYAKEAFDLLRRLSNHQSLGKRLRDEDFDVLRSFPGMEKELRTLQEKLERKTDLRKKKERINEKRTCQDPFPVATGEREGVGYNAGRGVQETNTTRSDRQPVWAATIHFAPIAP